MKHCIICSAQTREHAKFCPECGERIDTLQKGDKMDKKITWIVIGILIGIVFSLLLFLLFNALFLENYCYGQIASAIGNGADWPF